MRPASVGAAPAASPKTHFQKTRLWHHELLTDLVLGKMKLLVLVMDNIEDPKAHDGGEEAPD